MIKHKTEKVKYVPSNANPLSIKLKRGDEINLHNTNCTIFAIKKITRVEDHEKDFSWYIVSCDPRNKAWHHVSKEESTLKSKL